MAMILSILKCNLQWLPLAFVFFILTLFQVAYATDAIKLPVNSEHMHLGVKSCAGSPCHSKGTKAQATSSVDQNEFYVWRREGHHKKAYKHLENKSSARIVKKLGLKKAAYEEDKCLRCHADNVPKKQQGKGFKMSDGVGCEACHGGSENWKDSHYAIRSKQGKAGHQRNIENGLYPTERPIERARLCLSCHLFVSHEIMGA
jgi:hypothetical protein